CVNRTRDQLLAGAGLAVHEHGRIGRCDALNLFEHQFEWSAVADDLLESPLIGVPIAVPGSFENSHREPPARRARLLGVNSLKPFGRSPTGVRRRPAWSGTPPPPLATPASACGSRRGR